MICQRCQAEGKRSTIQCPGFGVSTLMCSDEFYDESGKLHHHDPNSTAMTYRCSNGHSWTVRKKTRCPSCDYNNEQEE